MAPRFKLNILWLENELGIAIDQIQAGEQIPLTDYLFWPKSDTWDQIRQELETKPWILTKEKAQLLNATATIMNEWQNSMNKTAK
jgi:30S ribosomal protein 3